ncbi:DUF1361 domain-containing protein [Paucilactobacillus hokkaidonensis]|nr:DUF1361 domain-containing protein [Paucilactobacillus hokkaidonensis]
MLFVKAPFGFLILNTFLGYLPIELSFQLLRVKNVRSLFFLLILLIWLLFYPNAPYVLTDLFHLSLLHPHNLTTGLLKSDPQMWLDFAFLVISALSCSLIGILQLNKICHLLATKMTPQLPGASVIYPLIFAFLSSIGIYMGRFLRIHSLYMLLTPTWFIKQIGSMWSINMWLFTLILTVVQLVLYWIVVEIRKTDLD